MKLYIAYGRTTGLCIGDCYASSFCEATLHFVSVLGMPIGSFTLIERRTA